MRLPYPLWMDTTPITATITDGIDDDGVPTTAVTYVGKCCFSQKPTTHRESDGIIITLTANVFIKGDIAPTVGFITGSAVVNNQTYKIYKGYRFNNPDGTIHHTQLELM